jgi:hypothetical protein
MFTVGQLLNFIEENKVDPNTEIVYVGGADHEFERVMQPRLRIVYDSDGSYKLREYRVLDSSHGGEDYAINERVAIALF